jgi:hypothetical protein
LNTRSGCSSPGAEPANGHGLPIEGGPGEIAVFDVARKHVPGIAVAQPRRALLGRAQFRQIGEAQGETGCSNASISGLFASRSISSSVTASSISNAPTHVRRSVTTWPRQPSVSPQIAGDGPDIAARTADEAEDGVIGVGAGQKRQLVHVEVARGKLHRLARPRDVIGAVAVDLHGRELRRDLPDIAGELRQRA